MLPVAPTPPTTDLSRMTFLIYGNSKIGKSTFCSGLPSPLFLASEPGLSGLNVHQLPINSWADMRRAIALLSSGDHHFQTIVIDTIDIVWNLITKEICYQYNANDIEDIGDWSKGSRRARELLDTLLIHLGNLPYLKALTSHAQDADRIEAGVGKVHQTQPTLSQSPLNTVLKHVDIMMYAHITTVQSDKGLVQERVVSTHSARSYLSGSRFQTLIPDQMPLNAEKVTKIITDALAPQITTPVLTGDAA